MISRFSRGRNAQGQKGHTDSTTQISGTNDAVVPNLQRRTTSEETSTKKSMQNNKIRQNSKLYIATLNVRTLQTEERLIELENALKEVKWDILGLSEVRRNSEKIIERETTIFYHFGETKGLNGIGFLVKKDHKDRIVNFKSYSERIGMMEFKVDKKQNLSIIQVYAPTGDHSDAEIEEFYELLEIAIEDCRHNKKLLIMGDFNAAVGKGHTNEYPIMGGNGSNTRNERGRRLLQFASAYFLSIGNSFFNKKEKRRWTWQAPNGITKKEIDYILTNDRKTLMNVEVLNNFKFYSDHRLVRAAVRLEQTNHSKRLKKIGSKLNFNALAEQETNFKKHLKELINERDYNNNQMNAQDYADYIEKVLKEAYNRLPRNKKAINSIITQNTKNLIEKRESLKNKRLNSDRNKIEYAEINKLVKREIRKDKRNNNMKKVQEALENNTSLRTAKDGLSEGKYWITSLKDANGTNHNNRDEILKIATEYYKNLYKDGDEDKQNIYNRSINEEILPEITKDEIKTALKYMKNGKSPGGDNIPIELVKFGLEELMPILKKFFNEILQHEIVPDQWLQAEIVLLHKKGSKSDMNNYRPISLLSQIYKLFARIIQNRISDSLDFNQPVEQAGFRKNYSTIDHLHTINQIIEKYNEYNKPLYIAFIDFKKAFDSIKHKGLFEALKKQGIEEKYLNILKFIYKSSSAKIKMEKTGECIKLEKGVKQGDPLSPKMFTSLLEQVFRTLDWEEKGVNIQGKRLNNLRFADDIVLFADSLEELQEMMRELCEKCNQVGLQMNFEKTSLMSNHLKSSCEVDGFQVDFTDHYRYLGQIVSFEERLDKEIQERTSGAWKNFWRLKEWLKSDLPIWLKRKIMDMSILPTLTYGAQTWAPTKKQNEKIRVSQRAMERSILGISRKHKVTNEELRKKTKIKDVCQKIRELKWNWAGHVARLDDERWTKIVTEWIPREGKRSRGRPKTRWKDEIVREAGPLWTRTAQDRDVWSQMGEAFAQQVGCYG